MNWITQLIWLIHGVETISINDVNPFLALARREGGLLHGINKLIEQNVFTAEYNGDRLAFV